MYGELRETLIKVFGEAIDSSGAKAPVISKLLRHD